VRPDKPVHPSRRPPDAAAPRRRVGVYTTRKKAIGPFKRQIWELATKDQILASQAAKIAFLFDQLKLAGTTDLLRFIATPAWHRPMPESLGVAVAG
jgi:hypothetical protein